MSTDEKEQRVFKNNGKRFEEDFKASFPEHIWAYRPPDTGGGMLARFTQESICDLMAYNTKNKKFMLMELKSTLGTSVSFKPYELAEMYNKEKAQFEEWISCLTPTEKKEQKEEIKNRRAEIKGLYKELNQGMIKYHQIANLLESKEKYDIDSYIVFTFFRTTKTYALPIKNFVESFWRETTKKSINENDLDSLVKKNLAYEIKQSYINRSMRSEYDINSIAGWNNIYLISLSSNFFLS